MTYKRLVATHVKADFDAIASAWGACRLYNCDAIILATDAEPNVLEYLKTVDHSLIHKLKAKEIQTIQRLDFLAVTDCKLYKRLGPLAPLTGIAEELAIYDHHISFGKDLNGTEEYIGSTGACTTLVVQELFKAAVPITPQEATLYLLGIYEDTGLLTFSSTTPDDLFIAARLLELGGKVNLVNDYIKRELSRTQVFILNELLINMAVIKVGDVDITYSYASIDEYTEELAFLVHRMMDMEDIGTLFVLVRMGSRIVLVARSKEYIDVSGIAARFGGGGHPQAASASIKDLELHEAIDILKVAVRESIRPVINVSEIMTSPALTVYAHNSLENAWNFTLKHNLNNIPVLDENKTVVGIISRKDILQAVKHEFKREKVASFMQTEFQSVKADTPFRVAEDIMLSTAQKLVPVINSGLIAGVITRTDLLRLMHEETMQRSNYEEGTKARLGLSRSRNITNILKQELPSEIFSELKKIGAIAESEGLSTCLVGGYVRDILMGYASKDIDIVVEGDAPKIAKLYADMVTSALSIHEKYKTATVTLPIGLRFDFATARTEYYVNPGAAPYVEVSSIKNDLARRDFTINAMAVRIDGEFGQLVDYYGGQRDILDRKLRVLHSLSIIDDPSRAFRAVRFAARFGFTLGTNTERLIKDAERLKLYQKLNPRKLFAELQLILSEKEYLKALPLLKRYELIDMIAKINLNEARIEQFHLLEKLFETRLFEKVTIWHLRFILLFCDTASFKGVLEKFAMPESLFKRCLGIYYDAKYAAKGLKQELKPSKLYKLLSAFSGETLLFLGVITGGCEKLMRYLIEYRHIKPYLTGGDLKRLGMKASPEMGFLIEDLRAQKLDGKLVSKSEEEKYVKKCLNDNSLQGWGGKT